MTTPSDRRHPHAAPVARRALPAVAGLLGCAMWCGCRPADSTGAKTLAIVVSADTAGWIVPCGCTSNQSGGLLRRGSHVGRMRQTADVIVADAGGAPAGASLYDRLTFEAILRGELAMGLAAHNIGRSEALLGADYLREVARRLEVPFVSANIRDAAGRPIAEPLRIVTAAGRRVVLVGLLSERYATGQLQVLPPRQAAVDALREAAGQYDVAILLAYLPDDELRQLAAMIPEADLVVGGPTGQPIPPTLLGPTLLASATIKGKFLACLERPAGGSAPWSGNIVELNDRLGDDAAQAANLTRFRRELARADLGPEQTSFASPLPPNVPADYRVAGNKRCRACHEEECDLWDRSRHAGAWKSLEAKQAQADPYCQRCHAMGYGLPGGFASAKRDRTLVGVGCESCHGPSLAHVRDTKVLTAHGAQAANQCPACHDRENSPGFSYETYWARVRHGQTDAATVGLAGRSRTAREDSR